jgi:ferredoxin
MTKVTVDNSRCSGHALCFAHAPEFFVMDDLGYNVTGTAEVPESRLDEVRRAALACPELAITIDPQ